MPVGLGEPRGPWRFERLLARGGQAEVYAGVDLPTGAPVALKRYLGTASGRRAWRNERRIAALVRHPALLRVYAGGGGERPVLVMQRAQGTILALRGRPWLEVRGALSGVLDGLEHLHQRGIIHRDIKPSNLLLVDEEPRIADFAVAIAGEDVLEPAEARAGTPTWMAPEQNGGGPIGPATDLYALGGVAWTLLAGRPPFGVLDRDEARAVHLAHRMPRLVGPMARVEGLESWLHGLLAKRPSDRFATADDAARAMGCIGQPSRRR